MRAASPEIAVRRGGLFAILAAVAVSPACGGSAAPVVLAQAAPAAAVKPPMAVAQAAPPARLAIDLRARALEPGEPVRVVVEAPAGVESVDGTFLGDPVFFTRRSGAPKATDTSSFDEWSGWAMIALDRAAGPGEVSVSARTAGGRTLSASRRVDVAAKEFPEQRLTVKKNYVSPPPGIQKRIDRERARLAEIYESRRAVAPGPEPYVRPVPGQPTGVFGTRRFFNDEPRAPHSGLDLRAATGTPVKASGSGVVVLAGDLYYSGNTVIVDHGGGLFTLYAHLSSIGVAEGEMVDPGRVVGRSGATGRVTGPHLHWGAKLGDRPFDPTALLEPELFR